MTLVTGRLPQPAQVAANHLLPPAWRLYHHPVLRRLAAPIEARTGKPSFIFRARSLSRRAPSAYAGLEHYLERWAPSLRTAPADDPIFVLASGWRSGSTLLQRLIVSSGQALIWGEPHDLAGFVQTLARSFRPFGQEWPPREWILDDRPSAEPQQLSTSWIANICPNPAGLLEAHRAFLRAWLAAPASDLGYTRWGFKEVRLGALEIAYLRALFPHARIVLLVRDPVAAWRSYSGKPWIYHHRWPDHPLVSARGFADLWNGLVAAFLHAADNDPHCFLVRYEDLLRDRSTTGLLARFLHLEIDSSVIEVRERGWDPDLGASPQECQLVALRTRRLGARLGYDRRGGRV